MTTPKLAPGAITPDSLPTIPSSKLPDGVAPSAKIADGAVTTAKIAADSVTGAKIPDGSIGLAEIQDSVVMEGRGAILTERALLTSGQNDVVLLTFPGIGVLRADCGGGGTAVPKFVNTAGVNLNVHDSGVENQVTDVAAVARFKPAPGGILSSPFVAPVGGITSLEWQASYTDASGVDHVVTAWTTAGAAAGDCVVTAHAITTG